MTTRTDALEEAAKLADKVADYWRDTGNGVDVRHEYAEHGAREAAREIRKLASTLPPTRTEEPAVATDHQALQEAIGRWVPQTGVFHAPLPYFDPDTNR